MHYSIIDQSFAFPAMGYVAAGFYNGVNQTSFYLYLSDNQTAYIM
jgi:hypothetical protein